MSTLAVIGDVHARLDRLDRVLAHIAQSGADGVLLVGDLACAGFASRRTPIKDKAYRKDVADVLARVEALGLPVAFVPGNHDHPDIDHPANVDRRVADVAGLAVGGLGGAGPMRFGFSYEWDEAEVRARPAPGCDVLLCHAPPRFGRLDVTRYGSQAGSVALAERALAMTGVLVCGHIHEAGGVERVGDCLCLNAGGLGEPFGGTRVGYVHGVDAVRYLDLDEGCEVELER